ncbi:hypothetical protein A3A79_01480 [Candidatus Gottesmanbacteria bacterium RIFCSPLOWO2_01_FULL_43_11b]|uniref:Uncharacterized protein n=1 Tax=Candidatus Gottesmanbacteria bacterium RIFCSPLOWO2_01_FULL_43_11b TaxID=1798392 RepID=A0A1F6AHW5_9BACT|nr:MAG: hypothetical protein A3A79_01480 [Candidatus Gottesmanbacteria bacterium RIFCSPLOWO2_01_FULL_43_11b]
MKLINNEPPPGASPEEAEKWRRAVQKRNLLNRKQLRILRRTGTAADSQLPQEIKVKPPPLAPQK